MITRIFIFVPILLFALSTPSLAGCGAASANPKLAHHDGLKQTAFPLSGQSTLGAQGTAYWDNDDLRFVTATYYGETGKRTDQVSLFDDGSKIAISTTEHYDRPISVDGQNVVGTITRRLVICPDNPLNFPNGDEYEDLLQSATDLIAKARDAVHLHKPVQSR